MKNATKFIGLVMLLVSSITFAFGQSGANKMTLEQKIAYDNSVVVKQEAPVENFAAPTGNRGSKALLLDEDFGSGIPGTWFQIQYSGTGIWEWSGTIGGSYGVPPNSDGLYATADSDAHSGWSYNVGLFTPSMDMSGGPMVEIDFDRNFQAFTGDVAAVRVYSGGTSPADLEVTLWQSNGVDDPFAGVHASYVINPTVYSDPSDVYIEFFYLTGGTWQWNFAIDNVYINLPEAPGDVYGYVFNGGGLTIAGATVGIEALSMVTTTGPDGYYELIGSEAGNQDVTAVKAGYNAITHTVFIPSGGSVQQDFILTAPNMIISPTQHTYTLNPEEYFTTSTGILNNGDGPLTWSAQVVYPITDGPASGVSVPAFTGTVPASSAAPSVKAAPANGPMPSNTNPVYLDGITADNYGYLFDAGAAALYQMDMETYGTTMIGSSVASAATGDFPNGDFEMMYVAGNWGTTLFEVDITTGASTTVGSFSGNPAGMDITGMATDRTSGTIYVCGTNISASFIGTLDPATGAITQIGPNISVAPGLIDIAIDGTGQMYGWCIVNDNSYLIDKSTGTTTLLGSLGFDANYGQGGNWNPNDDVIYLSAYNSAAGPQLRALDPATGATTLLSSLSLSQAAAFGFPGSGGGGAGNWLTLDYYENIVAPGGGLDNVPTNFNAAGTQAGEVYTADLVFTSSNPNVGTITIPCTMIIAGDPLVPPTDLIVELVDDVNGVVELSWTWNTDAFQFFILKRNGAPIGTSTTTSYIDNLPGYGTYCYTVQSYYDEGTSAPSNEECIEWAIPEIFINPDFHAASVWVDHQYQWATEINNLGEGSLVWEASWEMGCEHEVRMYDDFGDGWNGGTLTVYVDGDPVLTAITLASGSGPQSEYFSCMDGQTITTTFTCGSWCYECSYYIYDGFGGLLASDGVGGVNPTGITTTANCPPTFIVEVDPMQGVIPGNGSQDVTIKWDATGYAPGVYYQDITISSNDPFTPEAFIGNEMTVYVPAQYAGMVEDCESGLPISGVTVTAGAWQAITDNAGEYSLFVDEGTYDVYFDKLGYESVVVADTLALAGVITPIDLTLCEAPYPVPWVLATVNYPDEDFCDVEWSLPEGPYELIYDDGEAEDLFAWNAAGNENAVLFTPAGYPAHIFGGRVFVGDGSFPAGSWLGTDFAILVYDDDGENGLPGTVLDSIGVTVNNYGWVSFTGLDVTLEEGEFYLSMLQLNASPNTAPIGIDMTAPLVYRSYSRTNVAGIWSTSVYQDFMMRAYIDGPQTDAMTDGMEMVYPPKVNFEKASKLFTTANNSQFVTRPGTVKAGSTGLVEGYDNPSDAVEYYVVARMSDFDPIVGPASGTMTVLNNVTGFTYQDTDFGALPMGWYAYAVQVVYSTGYVSPWTYSNIVGRDMDAEITFEVTQCDGGVPEDVEITMSGTEWPFEEYFGVTDATGIYVFEMVWKGKYDINVYKIGYEAYAWDVIISGDETFEVVLSEKKYPPRNLWVDPLTSYAYWDPPLVVALDEDFEGTLFPPEGWQKSSNSIGWFRTANGSSSAWTIPAWTSFYACANDDAAGSTADGSVDYLITPPLDLREVDTYRMMFDSYYDALYGLQIATVEYSYDAGANWTVQYALTPSTSWEYIDIDLASFSGLSAASPVWFAFHADDGGGWASGWAIDNVLVANGETDPVAYHVYLDGALDGVTDTTFYQYEYLTYGVTYTASVAAQYSCGLSEQIYYTFGSTFLLPPRNIDGLTFDNAVQVWWEVPIEPGDVLESTSVFDPNFVPSVDVSEVAGTSKPEGYKPLASTRALLYDNGPLVNSPGTGSGGADESVLHSGLGTYGFGIQYSVGNRMADDFEVTGNWNISDIVVYGYQTNSGNTSTFTGAYIQVYDGDPSAGGTVIWGDLVTNRLIETDWTGIYRVNVVNGGTARPIMYLVCETPGLSLTPGTYWIDYTLDGTGSSGPWAPPITIDGVTTTGNALQYTGTWGPALDGSFQQGMPFLVNGNGGGGGGGGGVPDNLLGYNLYRDMDNIAYIPYDGEDTSYYWDFDLEPLCYGYDVTALYDLTPYGFPGEIGESAYEGTLDICVEFGWPLEFIEDWTTGSFDPNLWTNGDNWVVNGQYGNPQPTAEFKWDPVLNDYKSALTSYPIDGKYHPGTQDEYIDGRIWFDFDLSLVDNSMSGNEMLRVEIWDNGTWYNIATVDNAEGSFDWTTYHFDISNHAFGKIFKVRFMAEGVSSDDILSWYVDNIHIYRQCDAPTNLMAEGVDEYSIELNWSAPAGGGGGGGGGEWLFWDDGTTVGGIGLTGGGVFSVASHWDPDMLTAYEGMYITKIRFVPYANALTTDFTLKVWEGANAGTLLYEEALSGLIIGDWNEIELATPVAIDVTQELWFGYTCDSPDGENPAGYDDGPAIAGYGDMITLDGVAWDPISSFGAQFDLNWNLQAWVGDGTDGASAPLGYVDNTVYSTPDATPVALGAEVPVSLPEEMSTRALTGYNIYWNNDGAGYVYADFTTDTFYLHVLEEEFVVGSLQCYYVEAVYEDCVAPSNEACWIATGIGNPAFTDGISVYPNPARNILNVVSTSDITHVTIMNYVGQVVYNQKVVEDNDLQLNVAGYETGVYMVKVETTEGILVKKVTIAH